MTYHYKTNMNSVSFHLYETDLLKIKLKVLYGVLS